MAESIQKELDLMESAIVELEQALPQIIASTTHEIGIDHVNNAVETLKGITFDPDFSVLAEVLEELNNLKTASFIVDIYQAYLTDVLEMFVSIADEVKTSGLPKETKSKDLTAAGRFLISYGNRVMNRYRIRVLFEPDYKAKAIRAFMVLKELATVCRFLNVAPDLTSENDPNLDDGLDVDVLSQKSPEELHRLASSVLEVQSIDIFTETKQMQVKMLDPPHLPSSFDDRVEEYLNN